MSDEVDLFRYHDLTHRLAVHSLAGGAHLRGDVEDLQIVGGAPALADGEREHARLTGAVLLAGPRTSAADRLAPALGLVLQCGGTLVVTSHRLILLALRGATQLGQIGTGEVHTFVLPWDLVDRISMPTQRSLTHRIAGGRPIALFSAAVLIHLSLTPSKQAEVGQRIRTVSEDDVLRILCAAAARHRMTVSPPEDHDRLQRIVDGNYRYRDGEKVAELTPDGGGPLPSHLTGRLVMADGLTGARREAATLLLLQDD